MKLPEKIKQLTINAFGNPAGELHQPAHFEFSYTHNNPVSITMGYRAEPFNYGSLHPVFTQNLPEGYVRRYISEKLRRYANINDMYLLALQMNKGIGHLSYHSSIQTQETEQLSLQDILTWQGKTNLFHELLDRYYLNGLASGVQPKVLVNATNDTPEQTQHRSRFEQNNFIVKTFDDEFPLLTVNEYVCMECARACGLEPATCWLSEDTHNFVTERFDIQHGVSLGIEDFTVLLGKNNDEKYQSSYENLLKATQIFTRSSQETEKMYRYIVFNCLIGNGDAHLKNFSVQYQQTDHSESLPTLTLTPPYDITHTLIYDTIDNNMALKIAGAKSFPDKHTLVKLGQKFNIPQPGHIIDQYADIIQNSITQSSEITLMKGLHSSITKAVDNVMAIAATSKPYRHNKKRKYD